MTRSAFHLPPRHLSPIAVLGLLALLAACGDDGPGTLGDTTPEINVPDTQVAPDGDATSTPDDGDVGDPPRGPIRKVEVTVAAADWKNLHDHIHDPIEVACAVTIDGERFEGAVIEAHGGIAREFPKKSYRVELADEPDALIDLFGDGRERQRRFVLKSSWIDRSFLREALAMQLVRDSGGLAPRIAFSELWVNGELQGLYLLVERIDRPYFDRQGLEDEAIQVYKAENHAANWADKPDPVQGYDVQMGDDDTSDLGALLDACTHTPTTDAAFAASVEPLVALEDIVIFQRVHTFMGNRDTFTKNYYLYHDRAAAPGTPEARFRLVSWDADSVFGLEWEGTNLPGDQTGWFGTDTFSPRLVQVPAWRARHLAEYDRALGAELAAARLKAWVDDVAPDIAAFARADLAGWQPGADWDAEVERLKQLIDKRSEVMRGVIDGLR